MLEEEEGEGEGEEEEEGQIRGNRVEIMDTKCQFPKSSDVYFPKMCFRKVYFLMCIFQNRVCKFRILTQSLVNCQKILWS